jgi:integrase
MKIDPYKHKEKYERWKNNVRVPEDIAKEAYKIIVNYIFDMERGINVAQGSAKGARSHCRLNSIKQRMEFFARRFYLEYKINNVVNITEEQIMDFFHRMRNGEIKTEKGQTYKSTGTAVKIFKAFWHWWIKINKKNGVVIEDITLDLSSKDEKPKWVYLNEAQIRKLCDNAKPFYKVLIWFLYDTGIRSPTELVNIKVSDLHGDCKELHIRDEISKTFGRRIKLMLSAGLIKDYISQEKKSSDDYLFPISPSVTNQYLKRLAQRLFGDGLSEAGDNYSHLTMYDFRHCACCYWLPRYKSESALKYRFGWKGSDKIHYYSELLGMKDTINEEDLLVDATKTEIENRLYATEKENAVLKERLAGIEEMMKNIIKRQERELEAGNI